MVAMRWFMRVLGLVNIAILARILAPEDFGLVAMAMVAVGIADGLLNVGVDRAVLQRGHGDAAYFGTAWTIRLCQSTLIAGVTLALSPVAVAYYEDGRIGTILAIVAAGIFVRGFESIGVVLLRQQLRFSREFVFYVATQLLSVPATILLALELRSYLALALGMLFRDVAQTALSYALAPYRPQPTLQRWRDLWSISQWNLALGMISAIHGRIAVLILGKVASPDLVGRFSVATELALTPTSEIASPIMRAFFPGFVKLRDEPERLRAAVLVAFEAILMIGAAVCLGLVVVAEELVVLALGARWSAAGPLVQTLAVGAAFRIAEIFLVEQLFVVGRVKQIVAVFAATTLVFAAGTLPAFEAFGLVGVAALFVVTQAIGALVFTRLAADTIQVPFTALLRCALRPAAAGIAMVLTVELVAPWWHLPIVAMFATKIVCGAAVFLGVAFLTWRLRGSPPGLERKVIEILGSIANRLRRR
jgi:lipopolysaccharide exporter